MNARQGPPPSPPATRRWPWVMIALVAVGLCGGCDRGATRPTTTDAADATTTRRPEPAPTVPPADPPPTPAPPAPPPGPRTFGHLTVPPGALDHLAARLGATDARPLVVVHYGDSHSKGSVLVKTLRDGLLPGAVASPGTISVGHPLRWSASLGKQGGWTRHNWLYGKDTGSFGPVGVAYSTTSARARMTLALEEPAPEGARATVLYAEGPSRRPFEVRAGREVLARLETPPAPEAGLGRLEVPLPPGTRALELLPAPCPTCPADARVHIYGVTIQRPDAAVEYDNFGVGGTTIIGPHRRSDATLDQFLAWRAPDLVVLWYGANSSPEPELVISDYQRRYRELVQRVRAAAPQASCLLIGPPDLTRYPDRTCFMNEAQRRAWSKRNKSGADRQLINSTRQARACNPDSLIERSPGRVRYPAPNVRNARQWQTYKESCTPRTPPNLPEIVRVQAEVAAELGCAYFNPFELMGGAGSIMPWVCEADPQLASSDLIHLTGEGYAHLGTALVQSLDAAMGRDTPSPQQKDE